MTPAPPLQIDLDAVLRDKNPRLAHLLPRFVKAYLRRIIHQNEINDVLRRYSHLPAIEFVRATLNYMQISYHSSGLDQIPVKGRYLFASNHPFGGLDGLMLCSELERHFGPSRIIVNDILMHLTPLAPLFVPINKHGRQNGDYAQRFREALEAPGQLATFPAGLCSRRIAGRVCDLEWKPSFVKNALQSQRTIVPVYFEGGLSRFFYNLSALRTALGIKANMEMLYLADEMFRQRNHRFEIRFGTPISPSALTSDSPQAWCEEIRRRVYALADPSACDQQ